MRRTPPGVLHRNGVGAGLYGEEGIAALLVGPHAPVADEVRVERRVALVDRVVVATRRVRLPELDDGPAHWPPVLVEDAARQVHELADGDPVGRELGEVGVAAGQLALEIERAGRLRAGHWPPVQPLR